MARAGRSTTPRPALAEPWNGGLCRSRIGGGGEETRIVCGYLACDAGLIKPVVAGLPRVVRVHLRNDLAGEWLERSIHHAVLRVQEAAPGSDVILARLAEVVFTEALQRYVMQLPAGRTGWLAGASDATVGRSLAALHHRPAHPWTLDELAEEAGVSRSRAHRALRPIPRREPDGVSHRLAPGAGRGGAPHVEPQRRSTSQSDVGYESEAAFNRAFKRKFGSPPAQYRRAVRADRSATASAGSAPVCAMCSAR